MLYSTFVLLPMFVCLLWGISLILDFPSNNNAKKALTIVMLVNAVFFCYYGAYFLKDYSLAVAIYPFFTIAYLAVTPLCFIYTRYLSEKRDFQWRYLAVLFPALLMGVFAWVLLMFMDDTQKAFLEGCLRSSDFSYDGKDTLLWMAVILRDVARTYFVLQLIPLFFISMRMVKRYKLQIDEYYSEGDLRTLKFTKVIYGLLLMASILAVAFLFIPTVEFIDNNLITATVSLCAGVVFFALGYIGTRHNFTFEEFNEDMQTEQPHCEPSSKTEQEIDTQTETEELENKDLATRMKEIMVSRELFLKKELRISELSSYLSTNRTYISQAINQQMGCTFSDYVNSLRVEYAKKLLADPKYKMLTIEAVADMAGFTNSGSMNRSFKRIMNITPHSYRVDSLKKNSTFVA